MLSITLLAPWANISTLLVLLFITTKSGAGFPVKLQWTSNFLFCMTSVLSTKNPVIEAGSAFEKKIHVRASTCHNSYVDINKSFEQKTVNIFLFISYCNIAAVTIDRVQWEHWNSPKLGEHLVPTSGLIVPT